VLPRGSGASSLCQGTRRTRAAPLGCPLLQGKVLAHALLTLRMSTLVANCGGNFILAKSFFSADLKRPSWSELTPRNPSPISPISFVSCVCPAKKIKVHLRFHSAVINPGDQRKLYEGAREGPPGDHWAALAERLRKVYEGVCMYAQTLRLQASS
jgi:hypothetical protein